MKKIHEQRNCTYVDNSISTLKYLIYLNGTFLKIQIDTEDTSICPNIFNTTFSYIFKNLNFLSNFVDIGHLHHLKYSKYPIFLRHWLLNKSLMLLRVVQEHLFPKKKWIYTWNICMVIFESSALPNKNSSKI